VTCCASRHIFKNALAGSTFLVWPFYAREPNFNHSLWLILYSNTLDLKCMKWINVNTFWCDYYTMTHKWAL
jgi:hypothetical protein